MSDQTDVAIIGAGPNGLSLAAHLAGRGVAFRIFGRPMENWLGMPRDMLLKSEGFASSLYDPKNALPLAKYCRERGLGYADLGLPVPNTTFCEYGLAFQRRLVPTLDQRLVSEVRRNGTGYRLTLEDGATLEANRVVVATGITNFAWLPPSLSGLPTDKVTHSAHHADPSRFRGIDVIVVGGGSSAIDLGTLLHEAGAKVRLVTRRTVLPVHTRMRLPRPLADRLRDPLSAIGPGWRSCFFTRCASIVHRLPASRRLKWVKTQLGPAAGWFMAERVKSVPVLYGQSPKGAEIVDGKVRLTLIGADGKQSTLDTEHLIAATGYRPDVARMPFLDPELQKAIATLEGAPTVSLQFESSVPGLYFVGPATANSFGPLMRFAVGARFAAPRLARHLAASVGMQPAGAREADQPLLPEGVSPQIGARA